MLPGTFSGMGKVSGITVSMISSTIAAASSIAWPAGIQAGDVAVLFDAGGEIGSVPATVVPAGFTAIANGASLVARLIGSHKILTGSESGSIVGMAPSVKGKSLYIFRGSNPITAVSPSVWNVEGTSADPSLQNVLATAAPMPCVVFGANIGTDGNTSFSTASPAFDATANFGAGNFAIAGYKIYNASPANHAIDMADINDNVLMSGFLAFS